MKSKRFLSALLSATLLVGIAWPALASDHDRARKALQQGKIVPLHDLLQQVERDWDGRTIKVEFEHDDGHPVYKMRLLQANGRIVKLTIDAVDGRVLKSRRKER